MNNITSMYKQMSGANTVSRTFMTSCRNECAKMCKWKQLAPTHTKIIAASGANSIIRIKSHT